MTGSLRVDWRAVAAGALVPLAVAVPVIAAGQALPRESSLVVPLYLVLLGALVAGGVIAGVTGLTGAPQAAAESTSVLAAQEDLRTIDEDVEVLPQASISVAEARARLDELESVAAELDLREQFIETLQRELACRDERILALEQQLEQVTAPPRPGGGLVPTEAGHLLPAVEVRPGQALHGLGVRSFAELDVFDPSGGAAG